MVWNEIVSFDDVESVRFVVHDSTGEMEIEITLEDDEEITIHSPEPDSIYRQLIETGYMDTPPEA